MAENGSPENVEKQVTLMKEWVASQPHFPKDVDDFLLKRFLHSCYYDMEKAKTAAELFFTIRGSSPELVNDRDPQSAHVQKTFKIVNLAQLKISEGRNIWIWQLNDPGLENYDYVQDAKMFFLSTDAWLLNDTILEESDIVMLDVKDISLKFLTKFNMSVAKKLARYQEDALPIRLKQIHIVNAPPFIDKIYGLMKPFLKQEITELIHFHRPKMDTVSQFIDKKDLPEDYGGSNGKMEDHMKKVLEVVMRYRERLNSDLWRATDKKSKNKKDNNITTEIPTFRSLAID